MEQANPALLVAHCADLAASHALTVVQSGCDAEAFLELSFIYVGSGSPEGVIPAPIGSLYSRLDGGAGTSLYVKESGTGNVGWVGK